jgi:matrixin
MPHRRTVVLLSLAAIVATALGAAAPASSDPPTSFPGAPPAFAMPAGGHSSSHANAFGGRDTTLFNADGSVFALRSTNARGRVLRSEFHLPGNQGIVGYPTYAAGAAARAVQSHAPRSGRRLQAYCGSDSRNPTAQYWNKSILWYWVSGSTPGYLDPTNTLTSLRGAHTEWVNNDNWCGIGDAAAENTAYQGTIGSTFGQNGLNTVGWGSVDALNSSICPPNTGLIACTIYWYNTSTNVISEEDTRFDNAHGTIWYNGSLSTRYDVFSTMAHELGHGLGFAHVNDSSNVMWPYINRGDVSNRHLGRGDANENNAKY